MKEFYIRDHDCIPSSIPMAKALASHYQYDAMNRIHRIEVSDQRAEIFIGTRFTEVTDEDR
jgi:hypothetical protein